MLVYLTVPEPVHVSVFNCDLNLCILVYLTVPEPVHISVFNCA